MADDHFARTTGEPILLGTRPTARRDNGAARTGQHDVTGQRERWWRWPVAGLLLAVVFLTHDLAMAGDVHGDTAAVEPPIAHPSLHHLHASTPIGAAGEDEPVCHEEGCVPLADCGVGWNAAPASQHAGEQALIGAEGIAPASLDNFADPPPPPPAAAPCLSPGARRALLQVFLI